MQENVREQGRVYASYNVAKRPDRVRRG
jgi:hypothetical protein